MLYGVHVCFAYSENKRPMPWRIINLLKVCGANDARRPFNNIPVTENIASQGTNDALDVKYAGQDSPTSHVCCSSSITEGQRVLPLWFFFRIWPLSRHDSTLKRSTRSINSIDFGVYTDKLWHCPAKLCESDNNEQLSG